MTSLIQPSKVDWDLVDEELDKVPEEFKDPRFNSLRHVLDILSAVDAEAALEEVCKPLNYIHACRGDQVGGKLKEHRVQEWEQDCCTELKELHAGHLQFASLCYAIGQTI